MTKTLSMIAKVPLMSITVVRNGERVEPPVNKPFAFTSDEVDYISRVSPGALRNVSVEVMPDLDTNVDEAEDEVDEAEDEVGKPDSAEPAPPPTTGKKKPAGRKPVSKPTAQGEDDDI